MSQTRAWYNTALQTESHLDSLWDRGEGGGTAISTFFLSLAFHVRPFFCSLRACANVCPRKPLLLLRLVSTTASSSLVILFYFRLTQNGFKSITRGPTSVSAASGRTVDAVSKSAELRSEEGEEAGGSVLVARQWQRWRLSARQAKVGERNPAAFDPDV